MTHRSDDHDRDLKELFERARRAESRRAPAFDDLLTTPRRRRFWEFQGRRLLAVGFSTTIVASLAVLGAGWILLPSSAPDPASTDASFVRPIEPDSRREIAPAPIFVERSEPAKAQPAPDPVPTNESKSEPAPVGEIIAADELASLGYVDSPMPPASAPPVSDSALSREFAAAEEYKRMVQDAALTEDLAGRVAVVTEADLVGLGSASQTTKGGSVHIQDLPAPGRFYQSKLTLAPGVQDADGDGNPNVQGSRTRNLKAVVGGVSSSGELGVDDAELRARTEPWNAEGYRPIDDNPYLAVTENPLSTFSIDVDTASFSNVRRFLATGVLPPPDAVRIEELINYFDYDYPSPSGGAPFSTDVAIVDCPWNPAHRLARIGIKGREVHRTEHAGGNLVFLIDVSGSMDHPSKLPLLQSALKLMVEQLTGRDQVAIVVYAGSSGLVLDSTSGDAKAEILGAIDRLKAGGSTNGGSGLRLAYKIAREHFVPGGVNRVILATDGDFNVGVTSHGGLLSSIEEDAKNGIFLTALGFGYGNYQDDRLEHLADKGNGNYAYIDRLQEARKVLVDELAGTLITIAKDVKIQIEFNPLEVGAYRLIGYENRLLAKEDFNDDRKDAGEIGAGHTVTALYELVPPDKVVDLPEVDALRYQTTTGPSEQADSGEAFTLKLRYKKPEGRKSHLLTFAIVDEGHTLEAAPADVKFAAAVAQFGLLLRDSEHKGSASFGSVEALALEGMGADRHGYRAEFLEMVRKAESLVAER